MAGFGPAVMMADDNDLIRSPRNGPAAPRWWRAAIEIPFSSPRDARRSSTRRGAANRRVSGSSRFGSDMASIRDKYPTSSRCGVILLINCQEPSGLGQSTPLNWRELLCRSQTPGCDNRLPEEHADTCNHNNPKDKASRVATEGLVVAGRSTGRDRSCETTRSPASGPTSLDINKDFLNLPISCRCSQDAGRRLRAAVKRPVRCAERGWYSLACANGEAHGTALVSGESWQRSTSSPPQASAAMAPRP